MYYQIRYTDSKNKFWRRELFTESELEANIFPDIEEKEDLTIYNGKVVYVMGHRLPANESIWAGIVYRNKYIDIYWFDGVPLMVVMNWDRKYYEFHGTNCIAKAKKHIDYILKLI